MLNNVANASDTAKASVVAGGATNNGVYGGGVFTVQCFDKDGNLKWEDKAHNLVVNVGLADMNTKYFTGSSYTAVWYLGLITGPGASTTISATDTLASHGATGSGGWTENTNYSGNRKSVTFGSASTADPSVIDNSGSPSTFNMTGTATIAGAFLTNVSTGTSGVLFSASDFQAPGDRSVVNGDTLNVTYQFSLDAA
jgi:hypothetical protein